MSVVALFVDVRCEKCMEPLEVYVRDYFRMFVHPCKGCMVHEFQRGWDEASI
jgi:hypothetical protein